MKRLLPAAVLVALAAGGRPAAADDITLPFQVADRGYALRFVTEFERAAREGDWTTAADRLQQLLDLPAGDPVVIRAVGFSPARFEGSTAAARRLFDSLPREGRAAWEARSRAPAEELLARGLRLRRDQDLSEVARRYPAPDVRRRAFDALAQLDLARGDLRAARFHLESLLDAAEPADRPQVVSRLAWVAAQAGDVETLAKLRAAGEPYRDVLVPASPSEQPLGAFLDRMAHTAGAGAAAEGAPRLFGGDAHGTGLGDAPAVPGDIAWPASTEFVPGYDNDPNWPSLSGFQRMRRDPVVPVISHGLVFLNTGLSLLALNLSNGGTVWRYDSRHQEADWRDSFVASQTAALAGGTVYAALATRSDGVEPGVDSMFANHRIIYALPHRCLHAFDERTGDLVWSHDPARLEPGRADAAEIDRESVASPPLVVGDDLIVTAWTYRGIYDVRVVCYDRRTGATRWRTSIVQGQQELNLFGRPVKELVTGPIAESGGRVFLSSGLGVAASLHREDGRIAWLSSYTQTPIPPAMHWYETRDREVGWWMSPVYASADAVVMAPLDSPDLVCFAPATGELRWRANGTPSRLQRYRWFLGVTGGRAYVLGSQLDAFDLAGHGTPVWTGPDAGRLAPLKAAGGGEATGRGILTRDRVYVPTDRAIVVLSAATGAVEETWPLKARAQSAWATGNLVTGDGALLVVTAQRIDAYWRAEDLRARVDARLAASPDDPQARLDAGEFYASVGEIDLAIRTLEGALGRLPQVPGTARDRLDERLRHALYTAHVARAEVRRRAGDDAGAVEDVRAAAEAARDRGDRVRALFALADALETGRRVADAEAALTRVATELADVVTATDDGERAQAGALAAYRLGDVALRAGRPADAVARWLDLLEQHANEDLGDSDVGTKVRERLEALAATEPAMVRAAVRARAQRAFDAAKAARDVVALDRAARLYPDPSIAAEAALLAADLHLAADRPRDAIGVLTAALAESQPKDVTARALWKLAAAYRVLGETARERATLRRLAREAPDVAVDGGTAAADAVKRELAEARFTVAATSIPDPRPPLVLRWQAGSADQTPPQALRLAGSADRALDGRMVLYQFGTVSLVDSASGKPVWARPTRVEVRAAALTPGAIVVAGGDARTREGAVAVVALSLQDGRELWRQSVPGMFRASETTLGVMYLLVASRSTRPNYSIAAVSLGTGDLLQARTFDGVLNPQITPAEDAVVVTQQTRGKDGAQRSVITLDGTTLSRRGQIDVASPSSPFYVHPALSSVLVTTDGGDLVAVDVAKGDAAWRRPLADGKAVKAVFALPGALIVSDEDDALRRMDADTGRETWKTPLSAVGNLVYQGETAEGDLVVATLKPREGAGAFAVALDAATGTERWRRRIDLADENTIPRPAILGTVVAYELNERLERGTRSRVVVLDRATGEVVQEIEHPTIGKTYQIVTYGPDWIAVSSANEIAVYGAAAGTAPGGK